MKKLSILLTFLLLGAAGFGQTSETVRRYIAQFKDAAVDEMIRTGVPASITLAQGIHESGAGQSDLVRRSNNHFGIKCKTEWKGEAVYHDDDARGECFRKYNDPMESYKDHSDFLKNRSHYAFLFNLDPTDYEAWAYGLKKAGYATNPKYPQIIIKIIRDYSLQEYTLLALERRNHPNNNVVLVKTESNTAISGTEGSASIEIPARSAFRAADYPSDVFQINQTDVVFVPKGTSYLKIAEEFEMSMARLMEFNDLTASDVAGYDQLIFLDRKRKVGAKEFHVVEAGETLHDIAQKEGIRLSSLMALNQLRNGMMPKVGEKLYLQNEAPSLPVLTSTNAVAARVQPLVSAEAASDNLVIHTVQPKETVYSISKKYEVGVDEVKNWNHLNGTDLKIGQQLKIYKKALNGVNQSSR
jgi:LysM repeat protein